MRHNWCGAFRQCRALARRTQWAVPGQTVSLDFIVFQRDIRTIPTVDLLDTVIGIGTCSGSDTDKFAKFKLTRVQGKVVNPGESAHLT